MNVDLDDHSVDICTWDSHPILLFFTKKDKKKKIREWFVLRCCVCAELPAEMLVALFCTRSLGLSSDTDLHTVRWIPGFFTNKWKVPVENIKALAIWILFLINKVTQRNFNLRKH